MIEIKQTENGFVIRQRRYFLFIPIGWKVIREIQDRAELESSLLELIKLYRPKNETEE